MKVLNFLANPFYRFILVTLLLYLCWFGAYDLFLKQEGTLDFVLGRLTSEIVVYIMNLIGYDASYKYAFTLHYFYNGSIRLLQMVPACNGQVLYPLFMGFIIASPGLIKDKLKVICIGCILIFFINVIRVLALCLIKINAPAYLSFNHKYTFTMMVYACIFVMWVVWIKYFVPRVSQNTSSANAAS